MQTLELVKEFHEKFGHPVKNTPDVKDLDTATLRLELLMEEVLELGHALQTGDVVETFDALCDIQYVLDGAFLALGFHNFKEAGVKEVHDSNMSKLGTNGKPIVREDGKILKGPNYFPPDLESILQSQ